MTLSLVMLLGRLLPIVERVSSLNAYAQTHREAFLRARAAEPSPVIRNLSALAFSGNYPAEPEWAIGPFSREEGMTFRKTRQWRDPMGIGWESSSIFNPSLVEAGGKLLLFYRAAPTKESLCSRIGLAWSEDGRNWTDSPSNPIIHPTEPNETLGCDDPKIYVLDGRYYLFYNSAWDPPAAVKTETAGTPFPIELAVDICLATSDDLTHWEKRGAVVPYGVSKYWAKAGVLARNPRGEPVRINGRFTMFVSEGCGGQQHIGRSDDMLNWEYEPITYLPLDPAMGRLHEVACAVTDHDGSGRLVLDFFYSAPDGAFSAAQALYRCDALSVPPAINRGGTLSWGGLIQYRGRWLYAQGWDAPPGREEIHCYSASVKR
ncbi:MAG TPA: hypothetical protein PL033_02675 [Candidatus Brocadiia bacterium]|nr:hypothetical protein [Candidatus Brocadiia bacterium]